MARLEARPISQRVGRAVRPAALLIQLCGDARPANQISATHLVFSRDARLLAPNAICATETQCTTADYERFPVEWYSCTRMYEGPPRDPIDTASPAPRIAICACKLNLHRDRHSTTAEECELSCTLYSRRSRAILWVVVNLDFPPTLSPWNRHNRNPIKSRSAFLLMPNWSFWWHLSTYASLWNCLFAKSFNSHEITWLAKNYVLVQYIAQLFSSMSKEDKTLKSYEVYVKLLFSNSCSSRTEERAHTT